MPVILSIGNLIERKGHKYLILACKFVKHKPIDLIIVGEGKERNNLIKCYERDTYQNFGMNIMPRQTKKKLEELYTMADVFVLPSITDRMGLTEGLGLVAIEAIKRGIPVVAFDTGGVRDIIKHEETGYLCGEKDYPMLAKYIDMALGGGIDTDKAKRIIEQNFNESFLLEEMHEELRLIWKRSFVRDK